MAGAVNLTASRAGKPLRDVYEQYDYTVHQIRRQGTVKFRRMGRDQLIVEGQRLRLSLVEIIEVPEDIRWFAARDVPVDVVADLSWGMGATEPPAARLLRVRPPGRLPVALGLGFSDTQHS